MSSQWFILLFGFRPICGSNWLNVIQFSTAKLNQTAKTAYNSNAVYDVTSSKWFIFAVYIYIPSLIQFGLILGDSIELTEVLDQLSFERFHTRSSELLLSLFFNIIISSFRVYDQGNTWEDVRICVIASLRHCAAVGPGKKKITSVSCFSQLNWTRKSGI